MANLFMLSDAKTRSISPENFTGEKGKGGMATLEEGSAANAARDLGVGWKVNPFIWIKPGETFTLADIEGPGAIQHSEGPQDRKGPEKGLQVRGFQGADYGRGRACSPAHR